MEEKEIGKLLELLNEYEQLNMCRKFKEYDIENQNMFENDFVFIKVSELISKRYGFIKWLVENDKIDIVKVYENLTNYEIEIRIRAVKELLENNEEDTISYLKLLMLLSISDTPIEDLLLYLK